MYGKRTLISVLAAATLATAVATGACTKPATTTPYPTATTPTPTMTTPYPPATTPTITPTTPTPTTPELPQSVIDQISYLPDNTRLINELKLEPDWDRDSITNDKDNYVLDPSNTIAQPKEQTINFIGNLKAYKNDRILPEAYPELPKTLYIVEASPETIKGFTPTNSSSFATHIGYTPYVKDYPEVWEALRWKIMQEDDIFYGTLRQNTEDKNIWENQEWGRIANWSYHWAATPQNGMANRVSLLPWYDSNKMKEWFPDEKDRETNLRNMWLPYLITFMDGQTGDFSLKPDSAFSPNLDVLKKNMAWITSGRPHDRLMDAYNNPGSMEHKVARFDYVSTINALA